MAILAFRLFGPLAAWGTAEAGDALRPSARHPGRSAVFGLLGAALGLTREEEEAHRRLAEGYALAVAAHGPRPVLRDFRTVQTVEPPDRRSPPFATRADALARGRLHTMVSRRDHVQDGLWRVFLWPRAGAAVPPGNLAAALLAPRFDLYLGRRCCPPALPPDPRLIEVEGLEAALAAYPVVPAFPEDAGERRGKGDAASGALRDLTRALGRLDGAGRGADLAWDEDFPGAPAFAGRRPVRDEPGSRARRQFATRMERFARLEGEA